MNFFGKRLPIIVHVFGLAKTIVPTGNGRDGTNLRKAANKIKINPKLNNCITKPVFSRPLSRQRSKKPGKSGKCKKSAVTQMSFKSNFSFEIVRKFPT